MLGHDGRCRNRKRGGHQQGAALSPTWQLPVLEGIVHLRTLGPGIALTTGHHVAGKRDTGVGGGVRRGQEPYEPAGATAGSNHPVATKLRTPRAACGLSPALSSSCPIPVAMFPQRHVGACPQLSLKQSDVTLCLHAGLLGSTEPRDSDRALTSSPVH